MIIRNNFGLLLPWFAAAHAATKSDDPAAENRTHNLDSLRYGIFNADLTDEVALVVAIGSNFQLPQFYLHNIWNPGSIGV
jgi:hypothetical protein